MGEGGMLLPWLGCSNPGFWHHLPFLPGLCTLFLLPEQPCPALHLINSYSLPITFSRKPSPVPQSWSQYPFPALPWLMADLLRMFLPLFYNG